MRPSRSRLIVMPAQPWPAGTGARERRPLDRRGRAGAARSAEQRHRPLRTQPALRSASQPPRHSPLSAADRGSRCPFAETQQLRRRCSYACNSTFRSPSGAGGRPLLLSRERSTRSRRAPTTGAPESPRAMTSGSSRTKREPSGGAAIVESDPGARRCRRRPRSSGIGIPIASSHRADVLDRCL